MCYNHNIMHPNWRQQLEWLQRAHLLDGCQERHRRTKTPTLKKTVFGSRKVNTTSIKIGADLYDGISDVVKKLSHS